MMHRTTIIGVMGGGSATPQTTTKAYRLGQLIARQGWVLLCGGRDAGVMDACARGASDNGGVTVGILPGDTRSGISEGIQIPILTGMGNARNCINVLSSHVVVACPGGPGTVSEIALALKCQRPVILMDFDMGQMATGNPFHRYVETQQLVSVSTPEQAIDKIQDFLFSETTAPRV